MLPAEGLVLVKGFGGVGVVGSPLANVDVSPPPPAIPIPVNSYPQLELLLGEIISLFNLCRR